MLAALGPEHVVDYFGALNDALAAGPCAVEQPVAMRFALSDAGSWVLRGSPTGPGSAQLEADEVQEGVDCTISCTLAVLLDIASGRKRPMSALVRGQIRVSGDRSVFSKGWAIIEVMQQVAASFTPPTVEEPPPPETSGFARIEVHGASVHADESDRYAVYHVEVFEAQTRWTVTRRWSQLRALVMLRAPTTGPISTDAFAPSLSATVLFPQALSRRRPPTRVCAPGRQVRRVSKLTPTVGRMPYLPRMLDFAGSLEPRFLRMRSQFVASYLTALLEAFPTSIAA